MEALQPMQGPAMYRNYSTFFVTYSYAVTFCVALNGSNYDVEPLNSVAISQVASD